MNSISEIMCLCRLCLEKEDVNTPIFEEQGEIGQISLKISTCLPVKVSKEDDLPKNICGGCLCKLEMFYQFWNTCANADKKLVKWIDQISVNKISDKRESAASNVLIQHSIDSNPIVLKQEVMEIVDTQSDDLVSEHLNMSNDDQDYLLQQQSLTYEPVEFQFQQDEFETVAEDDSSNAGVQSHSQHKRVAAMRSLSHVESEDEDDPDSMNAHITKTEDDTDDSGEGDPKPTTFVGLPPDDNVQAGTSTAVQSIRDAPRLSVPSLKSWFNRLPEVDMIPVLQDEMQPNLGEDVAFKKSEIVRRGYKNPFHYSRFDLKNKIIPIKPTCNIPSKWTCIICNQTMIDKNMLIDHYESHKNEQNCKTEDNRRFSFAEDYFKCTVCGREFTSTVSYEKHLEQKHGENRYACQECNKTYKSSFYLCLHISNSHYNDQQYKCIHCDYVTTDRCAVKLHLDKHEECLKYHCDICEKKFFDSISLDEHKSSHSDAMPFQCEICYRSFPYASYLISHKKSVHLEMIVNKCGICDKQFAHRKSLILHVRTHTGENAVLCDICGKSLSSAEHLKQHLRIHSGFKPHSCGVCGKGFAKKSNLTLHERVHSGEKPYVCKECGKCFSQRSTLVIHERYHSGERPYSCPMCNKGFVAKGLLGVHIKSCSRISL